jgi:hypothetical protein
VDKYEEYLVRKIAELLYVPHREFIRMKLEVIDGEEAESAIPCRSAGTLINQEK